MRTSNHPPFRYGVAVCSCLMAIAPLGAMPRPPIELRTSAPEQLLIEVISVKVDHQSAALVIEAQANVIAVSKTGNRMTAGQTISIRYTTYPQARSLGGCTTPQMPILIKARQYKSYLEKGPTGTFAPAASWLSFEGS